MWVKFGWMRGGWVGGGRNVKLVVGYMVVGVIEVFWLVEVERWGEDLVWLRGKCYWYEW